jgi:hypothetical protein
MLVFSDSGSLREDATESSFLTKDKVIRVFGFKVHKSTQGASSFLATSRRKQIHRKQARKLL